VDFYYRHIENVMQSLGIDQYVYEAVFINASLNQSIEIYAYNEFYFLVGVEYHLEEKQRGFTLILGENDILELDSDASIKNAIHTEHFTGKISISLSPYGNISGDGNLQNPLNGKCVLNFIRVTPTNTKQ